MTGTQFYVSFPFFGIEELLIDKIAFTLPIFGGLEVRWYGIIITLGIVAGLVYALLRTKTEGIPADDILDYAILTVILAIIGARLYYVLTSLDKYDSFLDAIAIWEGGLAIYGAIIGGALALIIVSKLKKYDWQKTFKVFDMVCPGVMLGQIIGRWGNFMNGEAYGYEVGEDFFMRMGLMGNYADPQYINQFTYYHPTFLYESLWNLVGFVLINIFYKKKKFDGQITLMYLAWYGLGRFFVEGLRTDSLYIGAFRISQVLGLLCFVACTTLLVYLLIRARRKALDAEGYTPVYEKLQNRGVVVPENVTEQPEQLADETETTPESPVPDEKENENGTTD